MDRRRRTDPDDAASSPPPNPCTFLRDVSNYKTPRPHPSNPFPIPSPIFFTAHKTTPFSSVRRRPPSSAARYSTAAARRLKALELDQSRSSRKAQIRSEKSVKSIARSISAWLNFLFRNPKSRDSNLNLDGWSGDQSWGFTSNRKRESLGGGGAGMGVGGRRWRSPKRQRSCDGVVKAGALPARQRLSALEASLRDVCSIEDLKERMLLYMSEQSCDEVLLTMSQVCKNIDEGRLKMKAHCPLITDLGLKAKATAVLMCYNPIWLRIGLNLVFGGDSLLLNEEGKSDEDDVFLKMIIDRQLFSHAGIARAYSYNKLVEGLYRPGYFEALGNIILKRFLLLVIALDKAKCESTLPLKYGIDGIDGGSPLLFCRHSHIKSSRQVIQEFLSGVMHGEGDLLAHLAIVGCKVNHQQSPLSEHDFIVENLFEDLQDGILLCRAIQLLQCDASILYKLLVPSDTRKKNLHNCSIAMIYLKQAGVPLSDRDGVVVVAEDVANGDKELLVSVLWNIFVHLQVPILINRTLLAEEISKINGFGSSVGSSSSCDTKADLCLILDWIQNASYRCGCNIIAPFAMWDKPMLQAICQSYNNDVKVDNLSLSDGKALRCLVDYYFKIKLNGCSLKDENCEGLLELLDSDSSSAACNLLFVQRVAIMLGIPEVLQTRDILDEDAAYDERILMILLVFLAAELIHRKTLSPELEPVVVLQSALAMNSSHTSYKCRGQHALEFDIPNKDEGIKHKTDEWAARVIQSQFRRYSEQRKYLKIRCSISLLQNAIRAWLVVSFRSSVTCASSNPQSSEIHSRTFDTYLKFMVDRHGFVRMRASVLRIQRALRAWVKRRRQKQIMATSRIIKPEEIVHAATSVQAYIRGRIARSRFILLLAELEKRLLVDDAPEILQDEIGAATKIQAVWRSFSTHKWYLQQKSAAITIQKHWRCRCSRKEFLCQVRAIINIQSTIRSIISQTTFKQYKIAVVLIQRFIRGWTARKKYRGSSYLHSCKQHRESYYLSGKSLIQESSRRILSHAVLKLQRWWRQVLFHRSRSLSAILIQSCFRGWIARTEANRRRHSISMIQLWWRNILFHASRKRSAVTIQAYVRGWLARREAVRNIHRVVVIQAYWRGYTVRKRSKQQVLDLCYRVKKSAANVDDSLRLINRLVAALSDLLGYKSIANIRHTCATLDMATGHSSKCCETLVAAGAIDVLLSHLHSLNRGLPDQEVLKHVLSIFRNIVCYRQLAEVLIKTPKSVEIIFQELLRNKGEGFFLAAEILQKICATQEGLQAVSKLQGHVRRLRTLAQDLERKLDLTKRNARLGAGRDAVSQRLRETLNILQLIFEDH